MENAINFFLKLHIPLIVLSYLLFLAASLSGLTFIVQEHLIKTRPTLAMSWRVPPLDAMERFIFRTVCWAFPLLSVGILLGTFWARQTRGEFWAWDPSETFALITWGMYVAYLGMRGVAGWRGRKSTYLALSGFALILISLMVLMYYSPLHQSGTGR